MTQHCVAYASLNVGGGATLDLHILTPLKLSGIQNVLFFGIQCILYEEPYVQRAPPAMNAPLQHQIILNSRSV